MSFDSLATYACFRIFFLLPLTKVAVAECQLEVANFYESTGTLLLLWHT